MSLASATLSYTSQRIDHTDDSLHQQPKLPFVRAGRAGRRIVFDVERARDTGVVPFDEAVARHRIVEHDGRERVAEAFAEGHAESSLSPRPCAPPMLSAREKLNSM